MSKKLSSSHKKRISLGLKKAYAENRRTLCMDCHYLITYGKKKPDGVVWGHNLSQSERGIGS